MSAFSNDCWNSTIERFRTTNLIPAHHQRASMKPFDTLLWATSFTQTHTLRSLQVWELLPLSRLTNLQLWVFPHQREKTRRWEFVSLSKPLASDPVRSRTSLFFIITEKSRTYCTICKPSPAPLWQLYLERARLAPTFHNRKKCDRRLSLRRRTLTQRIAPSQSSSKTDHLLIPK